MDFKQKITGILKKHTGLKEIRLEIPPSIEMGDYAFPCFILAKKLKKDPNAAAQELVKKIPLDEIIKKVEIRGPYLNFFVNRGEIAGEILKSISKEREKYGSVNIKNKRALIEHTSINPNASPHVGRARNAIIGDAITRLLRFNGYKTEVHYLVNDVGKQIALLVLGARNKATKFNDLLKLYIKINERLEENKSLEKEVFSLLYKLEKGDPEVKKRFKQIVDICVKGQIRIFGELGIKYDFLDYESKYLWNRETDQILKKLEKTGKLFVDKDGRYVLDQKGHNLAMKSPVFVLTRKDKTSLYGLRDIAYNIDKIKRVKDENIIILGEDQKLYFQQIKAALELLGYKAPRAVHYSFVLLKTGKMSTRKGNLVLLEDFMKESAEKAKKEVVKRKKAKLTDKIAKAIGYGALKYSILKVNPAKNVIFDWDQALSFEGETGPYVQYSHARICSILKKHGKKIDVNINFDLLGKNEEVALINSLSKFPEIIKDSTDQLRPHLITTYVYELAKNFNDFYEKCPVLKEKEEVKKARLVLIDCTRIVLETGLGLLGIGAPREM